MDAKTKGVVASSALGNIMGTIYSFDGRDISK
jgi:hypothetical protein